VGVPFIVLKITEKESTEFSRAESEELLSELSPFISFPTALHFSCLHDISAFRGFAFSHEYFSRL
jgi:hypothetical protein